MREKLARITVGVVLSVLILSVGSPQAHSQVKGAIFTTLPDGSAVNFNIYASKDQVYLDGGPPPGAPQTAAGLPDGTYVFQVTDPSGKTLLSTDPASCRQFTVANGIITGVVAAGGCEHLTGLDVDHGAATVQLLPYLDTPNNGGEYKAWATPVQNYLDGCEALGVTNGLSVVDCGYTGGDDHGFIPRYSKTDNFKVKNTGNREIDTHFFNAAQNETTGICEIWIDTLGAQNERCSLINTSIGVNGWAHVEDVEDGIHQFVFTDQPGCKVGLITVNLTPKPQYYNGAQTINVKITPSFKGGTLAIWVQCQ